MDCARFRPVYRPKLSDPKGQEKEKEKEQTKRKKRNGSHETADRGMLRKGKSMDSAAQAEGEKRVREKVFEPLEALGMGRPTTVTKAGFEVMKRTVCQYLAGASDAVLEELRAWIERHPTGPNHDRFPIGVTILNRAKQIDAVPSEPDASPLMRNVFAHRTGQDALREGWAPELLAWFRSRPAGERKWPGAYTISQIKSAAYEPRRRLDDIELRLSRGDDVSADDQAFRNRRVAAVRECEAIAASAEGGA